LGVLLGAPIDALIRESDRLEGESWNAIRWTGGPAMPSPCSDAGIFAGFREHPFQSGSKKPQARRA
jgi:hypothetical protein